MADISALPSSIQSLYQPAPEKPFKGETLDRDSFLLLLTTQLQNQNPLEPMANEEFIAQLTSFSNLEQLQSMNGKLGDVYGGIAAMNNASMAALLGTSVVAYGDKFAYEGQEPVDLYYTAPDDTEGAVVSIYDDTDRLVATVNLGAISGDGSFTWDGKDLNGEQVPAGTYRFSISGTDADGNSVNVDEQVSGTITEMDYSTGTPLPSLNGVVIQLADIIRLTTGDDGT